MMLFSRASSSCCTKKDRIPASLIGRTLLTFGALSLASVIGTPLEAQKANKAVSVSKDSTFRTGKLSNGLTYFIRANKLPEKKAKLMLVVKAGSLQEDNDQIGMAHFVEHMAFNGTTRFPGNSVIPYLASLGVKFGSDMNAFTSWDRTVYEITMPTDKPDNIKDGIDILASWAYGITFDSTEVVDERGVIVEEWRGRLNEGAHIQIKHDSVVFNGSKHSVRSPIGTVESIRATNPGPLKRFYRDWYRPNLMAVVVVGDISPAEIESVIRDKFKGFKNPSKERAIEKFPIPENKKPLFSVVVDSLIPSTSIGLLYKVPAIDNKGSEAILREAVAFSIFTSVANERLARLSRGTSSPFRGASVGASTLTPDQPVFSITVAAHAASPMASLEVALTEVERIAKHGVTEAELKEAKTALMRNHERSLEQKDKTASSAYAQSYMNQFVSNDKPEDPDTYAANYKLALEKVGNSDIIYMAGIWRLKENRVITISAPSRPGVMVPEPSSVLSVIDDVLHMDLPQYVYEDKDLSNTDILPTLPTPGKIVSRKEHANGIHEWLLSNGSRVFLRPSTTANEMVALYGQSLGGFYRNSDSIGYVPASTTNTLIGMSGAGPFTAQELGKKLSDVRMLNGGPAIGPYDETVQVVTAVEAFETGLQVLTLQLLHPRLDTALIRRYQEQNEEMLKERVPRIEDEYRDTIILAMSKHHPFIREQMAADFSQINPEKSLQVFKDRFSDMSDFRYTIVGNFELDSIAPLVERYLASLPGGGRVEKPFDIGIRPPDGIIRKTVKGVKVDKASTLISFFGDFEVSRSSTTLLGVLQEIINTRLISRLREEMGAIYSPRVASNYSELPTVNYTLEIGFTSDPERVDDLTKATFEELKRLQTENISEAELNDVKQTFIKGFEASLKDDMTWSRRILFSDRMGIPFEKLTDDSFYKNLSADEIREAAKKYINLSRYAHFDLIPDKSAK